MDEQYFGTKELYEVQLIANQAMTFGERSIEQGEPVLVFNKLSMSLLNESSAPKIARGGWGNMPRIIWEDRNELTFSVTEGIMSSVGFGLLTGAKMLVKGAQEKFYIPLLVGPYDLDDNYQFELSHTPVSSSIKKAFCYEYSYDNIQSKVNFTTSGNKVTVTNGNKSKQYVFKYYYESTSDAIVYTLGKERLNLSFSLEGKYYTKDENDGINRTNIITIPKVRIISDINLRMGTNADPSVSAFNFIAMPNRYNELMEIVSLDEDIEE